MSHIKELQAVAGDLSEAVDRLMAARASDPARIEKLVADLSGTDEERLLAGQELKNGGQAIVVPLLDMLQHDPAPKQERDILHGTALLGHRAEAPLVAALDMPDDDVRAGDLGPGTYRQSRYVEPFMVFRQWPASPRRREIGCTRRDCPDCENGRRPFGTIRPWKSVVNELNRLARLHYQHKYDWHVDDDGNVSMWVWKREAESVVLVKIPPRVASNIVGSKFARQALSAVPRTAGHPGLVLEHDPGC